jgi:tryptophan 2,3-dioxygenase
LSGKPTGPLTYATYLKVDELLELQRPLSDGPEHDEMLFIVIHQVYELWFKQVLHELDRLQRLLEAGDGLTALGTLKRILTILKVLVSQIDVLETMTPLEFLSFRDRLESGSGFQSFQFREFEFAMGHKQRSALERYPAESAHRARLERRMGAPSLWDGFLRYLQRDGAAIPAAALARDVTEPVTPDTAVQAALVAVYRAGGMAAQVCERMVDLDEGVQEWRYRHVKMVQRTIGTKRGTGGSDGAAYLMRTLNHPAFPDLWAIRTEL